MLFNYVICMSFVVGEAKRIASQRAISAVFNIIIDVWCWISELRVEIEDQQTQRICERTESVWESFW